MEEMVAAPVSIQELVLGKLIPYFLLGLGSMLFCTVVAVFIFHTPLRGSIFSLFLVASVFLAGGLGLGLWVSTLSKSQFVAGQFAIILGFLPGFQLSGFLFEISSMPKIIQFLTWLFPARYFVQALQTIFLSGDVWRIVLFSSLVLAGFATLFFLLSFTGTLEVKHVALGIWNQDYGQVSNELIQRLGASPNFGHVEFAHSRQELQQMIDDQRVMLAITFLPDFSRKFSEDTTAPLQMIADGRKSNSAQIAQGYVSQGVKQFVSEQTTTSDPPNVQGGQ